MFYTYRGLSTDTKPTVRFANRTFYETDTRDVYSSDSDGTWVYAGYGPHIDPLHGVAVVEQGQFDQEHVAASATNQVLGVTGGVGDFLHRLVLVVSTAATAAVSIKDGAAAAIPVFPNSPGGGIGTYSIELNIRSVSGAWQVTTGAGVAVLGIGRFTP